MKKITLILAMLIALSAGNSFASYAKYVQTCTVKYATQDGWSDKYTVEVTFNTGFELNQATNSFSYDGSALYAVIFWKNSKATIIKINGYTSCGTEATKSCCTFYNDVKGKDQDGREWDICTGSYCF